MVAIFLNIKHAILLNYPLDMAIKQNLQKKGVICIFFLNYYFNI